MKENMKENMNENINEKKVWLITGSSTGIGRELAEELLKQGCRVAATARKPETIRDLVEKYPETAIALRLDVTQPAEAEAAIAAVVARFGRLDVLVNNAAYGLIGAIEEATEAEIRAQFETNFFGTLNVTRAALPVLRRQQSGHILNVSSFVGLVALPSFGYTCATKFAVEAVSESLAQEVAGIGIKVTIIEPGLFRTAFASENSLVATDKLIADYQSTPATIEFMKSMDGKQPNDPQKAARAIIHITEIENPPLRLPLGVDFSPMVQGKFDAMQKEFETWRELTISTGFGGQ